MTLALPPLLRERFRSEWTRRRSRRKFRPADLCRRGTRLAEQQLAFIADVSRWKVACCSRRAGKTHACAILLLQYALEVPEALCLYVTLTRLSGKRIVWRRLLKLNRDYELGGEVDRSELTLTLPNGSEIRIMGCKDEAEADKLRGIDPAPRLVVIDEAQAFKPYVQELVEDALEPMLIETKGTMVLIGTPGPVRQGYFYEACRAGDDAYLARTNVERSPEGTARAWSVHHWTIAQNPFIDDVEDELGKLRRRKAWTVEHPTYQREYLGRWVTEHDALVYKYDHARNGYRELPPHDGAEWRCIVAVDQGYHDADAIGRLWFRPRFPGVWLEEVHFERKQSERGPGDGRRRRVGAGEGALHLRGVGLRRAGGEDRRGRAPAGAAHRGGGEEPREQGGRRGDGEHRPGPRLPAHAAGRSGCERRRPGDLGPEGRGVKFSERYHTDIWDAVAYGMRRLVGIVPMDRPAELPVPVTTNELEERARVARIRARGQAAGDWVKSALGAK
jgi:hypothetical protein